MDLLLPRATGLALVAGKWAALTPDGELLEGLAGDSGALPHDCPLLVCHAPYVASRMVLPAPTLDILELFAFACPAVFCVPTIAGVASFLGMAPPCTAEEGAMALLPLARELLLKIASDTPARRAAMAALASAMGAQGAAGWGWSAGVLAAAGESAEREKAPGRRESFNVWSDLPEWSDDAPPPPPSSEAVTGDEARAHLADLITRRRGAGRAGEGRVAQENYATRILPVFAPREREGEPGVVTAQAGTGVGKTLGYLAPAQLWAETNEGAVWISTYTRNLQRQIETELETLYPDADERARKGVIRKGRENYLCLLNFEELAGAVATARDPRTVVAAGLMARWISATRDGDLSGNSFPGWLAGLLGIENSLALADRRGECIYAACGHYHRCFIERSARRARRARLVVGNHALAMARLALADEGDELPSRFVFDEGHHLFDAADSTFSCDLTGMECADFRRWVLGPEEEGASTRRARRAKGLRKRLEGLLLETDHHAFRLVDDTIHAARALPAPGWRKALAEGHPRGPVEALLGCVRAQVLARAPDPQSPWSIECDVSPPSPGLLQAAEAAVAVFRHLHRPLLGLARYLRDRLEKEYDDLGADMRARLDSVGRGLERRATRLVAEWIEMLAGLKAEAPETFVDWLEITRLDGREYDVGYFRHYRNPALPFAAELRKWAHGVLITSATLKSTNADDEHAWHETDQLTGAAALSPVSPVRVSIPSPFDYRGHTRVIVVRDVPKNDIALLAKAYEALFEASGGGALGLFTAIHRLRGVHARLAPALEAKNIPLYAQHVDEVDIGTLVDIFRAEEDACLLGTDAARDGVDVPGRSLRLIAFDRVPWPRPTILHRERRKALGGKVYDESLTRMKLRQAYGRLIRSSSDRGVFVLLDSAFPTRLEDSFPPQVKIERVSLDEALAITRDFFAGEARV